MKYLKDRSIVKTKISKPKEEENSSIRDIAKRIGWSKSKAHRLLIETTESDEESQNLTVNTDPPAEENNRDAVFEIQSPAEPAYLYAASFRQQIEGLHNCGWLRYETIHNLDQIRLKPGFSAIELLTAHFENCKPLQNDE